MQYLRKKTTLSSTLLGPESTLVFGLVISERLFNVPGDVAPHLHQVLIDDVKWSLSECPEDEKRFYEFEEFLVISHFLVDQNLEAQNSTTDEPPTTEAQTSSHSTGKLEKQSKKKSRKDQKKLSKKDPVVNRIYMHPEDEVLLEFSLNSWFFKIGDHDDGKNKYPKYRLIYQIKNEDYQEAISRMIQAM